MANGLPQLSFSWDEQKGKSNYSAVKSSYDRKERSIRSDLRDTRRSGLSKALSAYDHACLMMEQASKHLKIAIRDAVELERFISSKKLEYPEISEDLHSITNDIDNILNSTINTISNLKDKDEDVLKRYMNICVKMDISTQIIKKAASIAMLADKLSDTGFNFDSRLSRRLDTKGAIRVLSTAQSQLSRFAKLGKAKIKTHGRSVEELIDFSDRGF